MTLFRSNLLSEFTKHTIPLRLDLQSGLWARSTLEVLATTAVAAALLALLFV